MYLWLFPEFEEQKLRKWASGQDNVTGVIQEFLGPFGVGPFDVPGGRIMGDTTSIWCLELLEVWRQTGDDALLVEFVSRGPGRAKQSPSALTAAQNAALYLNPLQPLAGGRARTRVDDRQRATAGTARAALLDLRHSLARGVQHDGVQ